MLFRSRSRNSGEYGFVVFFVFVCSITGNSPRVLPSGKPGAVQMPEIAPSEVGPGALVLFRMAPRAIAKHVGILSAADRFIHAYERLGVVEEILTPVWARKIAFAFLFPKS